MTAGRALVAGLRRWAILLGLWCIPGLLSTSQVYLFWNTGSEPLSFWTAAVWQLFPWLYWAFPTPAIVWLARRFRMERRVWPQHVLVHLVANAVFVVGHLSVAALCGVLAARTWYLENDYFQVFRQLFTRNLHLELLIYWGVVTIAHALEYRRAWRERAVAAAQLETRLTQARLEALKSQLHPHFLFNTLNAIATLVRKQDRSAAVRTLAGLSDLLRITLDGTSRQVVPLKDELDFVDRYLELEKTRFGDRLAVERAIASDTLDAEVPTLLLQPLIENAIRHGITPRAGGGRVELASRRDGDRLIVTVRDDGAGLRDGWKAGVGIGNTAARLEQLHPGRHTFTVENDPRGGTLVTLEVPYSHG